METKNNHKQILEVIKFSNKTPSLYLAIDCTYIKKGKKNKKMKEAKKKGGGDVKEKKGGSEV